MSLFSNVLVWLKDLPVQYLKTSESLYKQFAQLIIDSDNKLLPASTLD